MGLLIKRGGWRALYINRVAGCRLSRGDRSHDIRSAIGREKVSFMEEVEYIYEITDLMGHCPLVIPKCMVYSMPYPKVAIVYHFIVLFRETMSSTASPKMLPSNTPKYQ